MKECHSNSGEQICEQIFLKKNFSVLIFLKKNRKPYLRKIKIKLTL